MLCASAYNLLVVAQVHHQRVSMCNTLKCNQMQSVDSQNLVCVIERGGAAAGRTDTHAHPTSTDVSDTV